MNLSSASVTSGILKKELKYILFRILDSGTPYVYISD